MIPFARSSDKYLLSYRKERDDEDDPETHGTKEPFVICDKCALHRLLRWYYSKHPEMGVQVLRKEGEESDSDSDTEAESNE